MGIDHPFSGHALNAVDAKGRVSVPAAHRAAVAQRLRGSGVVVDDKAGTLNIGPHPKGDRLVAYDQLGLAQLTEELRASVSDLPPGERREALAELRRAEIGNVLPVPYDAAGRMVLAPVLRRLAGITDLAYFIGTDDHIEIWAPDRAEKAFANHPMNLAMLHSYLEERQG